MIVRENPAAGSDSCSLFAKEKKNEKDGYNFSLCSNPAAHQCIGKTDVECIRLCNGGNLFCAVFYLIFCSKDIETGLACKEQYR